MNCTTKKRYPTKKMADEYVRFFNRNPLVKESDMLSSYKCDFHDGWHVGHNETKPISPYIKVLRLLDKFKRDREKPKEW